MLFPRHSVILGEKCEFFLPRVLIILQNGFPVKLCNTGGLKTGITGLPSPGKSLISSAVSIQCTSVADGKTDRHQTTASAALCEAAQIREVKPKVVLQASRLVVFDCRLGFSGSSMFYSVVMLDMLRKELHELLSRM